MVRNLLPITTTAGSLSVPGWVLPFGFDTTARLITLPEVAVIRTGIDIAGNVAPDATI